MVLTVASGGPVLSGDTRRVRPCCVNEPERAGQRSALGTAARPSLWSRAMNWIARGDSPGVRWPMLPAVALAAILVGVPTARADWTPPLTLAPNLLPGTPTIDGAQISQPCTVAVAADGTVIASYVITHGVTSDTSSPITTAEAFIKVRRHGTWGASHRVWRFA